MDSWGDKYRFLSKKEQKRLRAKDRVDRMMKKIEQKELYNEYSIPSGIIYNPGEPTTFSGEMYWPDK